MVVFCFGLCFALLQSNSQRKTGMLKRNLRVVQAGERTNPRGKPVSNRILLAIPDNEYRAIRPGLEFLPLPHHRILYEPNKKFEFVYFPNSGLISLVIVMADRKTVEVAVLGRGRNRRGAIHLWFAEEPHTRGSADRRRRFQNESESISTRSSFLARSAGFVGPLFGCVSDADFADRGM